LLRHRIALGPHSVGLDLRLLAPLIECHKLRQIELEAAPREVERHGLRISTQ
jgi:hypothetical protein